MIDELVRAFAGARREALREQRQAAPLRPTILVDVLAGLGDAAVGSFEARQVQPCTNLWEKPTRDCADRVMFSTDYPYEDMVEG